MSDDAEQLEKFIERLEELVVSMQGRLEKLEKQQEDAEKNTPFHLSMPMREFAVRKTVGYKGNSWNPMPRESEPRA